MNRLHTFGLKTVKYIADIIAIAVLLLHALSHLAFKRWLEKPINEGLNRRLIIN
ncbi:hypothetical protein [Nostoc sp. DedQUE09]|uniref:hypothetical protein n=1 Tax=Nostoc sp. DedQUE09 TaxID=3075394 RepID=UPI002AD49444|nr:hypothetical protein [Nostoc sp. DedQUE09]MDZ7955721.1 hypothetical protein [Nostoc sp. DedQUE09]